MLLLSRNVVMSNDEGFEESNGLFRLRISFTNFTLPSEVLYSSIVKIFKTHSTYIILC